MASEGASTHATDAQIDFQLCTRIQNFESSGSITNLGLSAIHDLGLFAGPIFQHGPRIASAIWAKVYFSTVCRMDLYAVSQVADDVLSSICWVVVEEGTEK